MALTRGVTGRGGCHAGSQLASMCLWQRALAHLPQPEVFVGLAGPYHIPNHLQFEAARGVAEISTMKPAMGGEDGMADQSPTVLAQRAAEAGQTLEVRQVPAGEPAAQPYCALSEISVLTDLISHQPRSVQPACMYVIDRVSAWAQ